MMKVDQKKILVLGGTKHMINVVETAKRMGLSPIVVDNVIGSPAKSYADKSYNTSTADIEGLAKIVQEEGVDGVFTAFEDINTWNAVALCKKMGLPFYATEEQLAITSNKDKFKEICRRFDVPVIEEQELAGELEETAVASWEFPVIIKPVDSYASKGITVCYDIEEVKKGFTKAMDFSKSKRAIAERFIDNSYGVQMFYTIQNSNIILTAVCDRYVYKHSKEHPPLPIAMVFPSKHQNLFIKTLDGKIRDMISGIGIQNGTVFIQSLYEDGNFYIYEMGFRLSGEQHYHIIKKQTDINILEMMLDFAVSNPIDKYDLREFDNGYMPLPSCNLPILLKGGIIGEIIGLDEVKAMPQVISCVINVDQGDEVVVTGSYTQMFGRFNIVADNTEALNETIEKIYITLRISNQAGEDMLLTKFVPEPLAVGEK
ncbi:hypothetical protein [Planomicrobium okeanokoites]|uniref:ATP-binding protein n=1 Tax=Planomicrobium okeanokoites TaxID=244 RepID=UPI000A02C459|nr:hypothetical protein [Planomicrobium okeanokoites]